MGFIGWILIGLIMGAIARAILPGKAAGAGSSR
ncbi:putative membrane protein YeaQ/YmgE (transglycosylase-associated protein family) [Cellulosimicrobium cellulans]|nr:putative membrane protein YeaQ/YmgE (transglycosylase-associated protein family) [Cellulosimicrobium cellulans]